MVSLKVSVLYVISTLSLALAAPAQGQLEVSGDLVVGEEVTVSYSNPDLAGEMVFIGIHPGGIEEGESEVILIALDEDGEGEGVWEVQDWYYAIFTAEDSEELTRPIQVIN